MAEDAFVRELRPLITIMWLLGWLPLHRVPNTSTLEFRVFSFATLYSFSMLLCQGFSTLWFLQLKIPEIQVLDPGTQLVAYVYILSITLPHIIMLPLIILQTKTQAEYSTAWLKFQVDFESIIISHTSLNLGLSRNIRIILASASLIAAFSLFQRVLLTDFSMAFADFLFALTLCDMFLLLIWLISSFLALHAASNRLLVELKLLQEYNESGRFTSLLDRAVLNLRDPWLQLCHLVRGAGNTFNIAQCINLFVIFGVCLYFAYQWMTYNHQTTSIYFGCWMIFSASIIIFVCHIAEKAQEKIFRDLIEALTVTKCLQISQKSKQQMLRFLLHLVQRSPTISLGGYVTPGHSLLSTFVSTILTYLAVLVQMDVKQSSLDLPALILLGNTKSW